MRQIANGRRFESYGWPWDICPRRTEPPKVPAGVMTIIAAIVNTAGTRGLSIANNHGGSAIRVLLIWLAVITPVAAQTTLEFDRVGVQPHRDYLHLLPFEQLDTQTGNILLTLAVLTLPGNAGHDLRLQFTFNSNVASPAAWTFGIAGVPMTVTAEDAYPTPGTPITNTIYGTAAITPILHMSDGSEYRTVFANLSPSSNDQSTMYEVWTSQFWKYRRNSHTLELPDGTVCTYVHIAGDPSGTMRLSQIVDVFGNAVSLAWSPGALQIQQTLVNESPRTVTLAMNEAFALPTTMTFNDGTQDRIWHFDYLGDPNDMTGRLTHITPPEGTGSGWRFDYEGNDWPYPLHSVTTPQGGRIEYTYVQIYFTPNNLRQFLRTRKVFDRGAESPMGQWDVVSCGLNDDGYCSTLEITTPSARLDYAYGPVPALDPSDIPDRSILIDGAIGLISATVRDKTTGATLEQEFRYYKELPVRANWYASAEIGKRVIQRLPGIYSTTYAYDTSDVNVAQYHCATAVTGGCPSSC